ncbi:hypothetical protein Fcan01_11035 [Folsomia candida]|uniref:Uncharacterized protein n=1 Tax=Folsomia candida TaxID=158441 RepID=A0A226EC93_FOLCA|nr:hypothetical protein Fcan01_11035 [Folsomia candida]
MWLTSFKPPLIHHLWACNLIRCTLFQWDPSTEQLAIPKNCSSFRRYFFKFQLFSHLAYALLVAAKIGLGKDPLAAKCQGVVFLGISFVLLMPRWHLKAINEPCQSLNAFLTFEKTLQKNGPLPPPSLEDKILVVFLKLLETSVVVVPLMVIAIQLHNPCAVPFFGSMSPFCQDGVWTAPPLHIWVSMLCVEYWLWLHIVYDGTFFVFYTFFVAVVCMLDYLKHVGRLIEALRIQKNDDHADFEDQDDRTTRIRHVFHTYRCVQLLDRILNSALKGELVPAIIGLVPQIQVFSLFVCIRLSSKIPFPGVLLFPLILTDASVVNFVVNTLAAAVNTNSSNLLVDLNQELRGFSVRSSFRKELKASRPTKIQFGQNFVDKGTPLVIENFCFNQTVSLLLLHSRTLKKVG